MKVSIKTNYNILDKPRNLFGTQKIQMKYEIRSKFGSSVEKNVKYFYLGQPCKWKDNRMDLQTLNLNIKRHVFF